MSDLVKRLRNAKESGDPWEAHYLATEAADEIERLRAALVQIAETPDHYTPHMVRAHARAALAGEKNDE